MYWRTPLLFSCHILLILKLCDGRPKRMTPVSFGPYYIVTRSVEECKASAPLNENSRITINNHTVVQLPNHEENFWLNFTVLRDVKITKGVLGSMSKILAGNYTKDYRQEIERPCDGMVFSFVLKQIMKIGNDCVARKGIYSLQGFSVSSVLKKYFKYVQHKTYSVFLELHSNDHALLCIRVVYEAKPLVPHFNIKL